MPKLHQLLAVLPSKKQRAQKELTDFYHKVQKTEPFAGISKVYAAKDEDGDKLPGEYNRVQLEADKLLGEALAQLVPMYDIVGSIDRTNMVASASIIIDGKVILADVPVGTLLWLSKQLADLRTVLGSIPILNPQFTWERNASGVWAAPAVNTSRTKKIPRNHVKAKATEKHPEQVEVFFEDAIVGTWSTQLMSGAMPATEVKRLTDRLERLREAVKDAQQRANMVEAETLNVGAVLSYLTGP
jgi:hypothetical protein